VAGRAGIFKLVIVTCEDCGERQRHVCALDVTPLCLYCSAPLPLQARVEPLGPGLARAYPRRAGA
jgi:hypothetical protein